MNQYPTLTELRMMERRLRWEMERLTKIIEDVLAGRMTAQEARERL